MLPNLYCQVSLLLKRRFAQKFVQSHGSRVQKVHFRLKCVAPKNINSELFFGAFGPYWSVWLVLPSSLTFLNLKDVRRKGTPSWEAETDILKTHPTIRLRHTSALYRSIQILRPISWVRWAQIKLLFKSIAEETAKSTMSSSCCECLSKPAAEVMLDGEEFIQEYTN